MEPAPQPVLSYASPINAESADVPTAMDLTFERPSVAGETTLYAVAVVLCGFALVFIGIMFAANQMDRYASRDRLANLIWNGVGFAIVTGIALFTTRSMIRLRRLGGAPVRIVLDEGNITVSDPVRLGPEPRILSLTRLRGCTCERLSLESSRYAIYFKRPGWSRRRVRVDVAAHERGVVERAAADLQRAIDRAIGKG